MAKVLVVGSVNGKFTELFTKAKAINSKHGPFEVLLCTGNFFGPEETTEDLSKLLNNEIDGNIPIPGIAQSRIDQNDGELCDSVYFMGKRGLLKTTQALRIAFLSGSMDPEVYAGNELAKAEAETENGAAKTEAGIRYTIEDIKALKSTPVAQNMTAGVDILLTHEWPQDVHNMSSQTSDPTIESMSRPVAEIAATLAPRYHFAAAANSFYEREPYRNIPGFEPAGARSAQHVTRFIGLAEVGNSQKARWFYAFNIAPMTEAPMSVLLAEPPNTTDFPLVSVLEPHMIGQKRQMEDGNGAFFWGEDGRDVKRRATGDEPPPGYVCKRCNVPGHFVRDCPQAKNASGSLPEGYVCRICNEPGHHIKQCPQAGQNKEPPKRSGPPEGYVCRICSEPGHWIQDCPVKEQQDRERDSNRQEIANRGTDACWFCLANPKVTKHLITSIGNEVYATLAKGPLVSSAENNMPGGGHILLIPITHYETIQSIPMDSQVNVITELERFKSSLRRMFEKYGQDMVVTEISRHSGRNSLSHAHIQIMPIPKGKVDDLRAILQIEGAKLGMKFQAQLPNDPAAHFFKMDLPDGESMIHHIQRGERFNLQFGRQALAKLMDIPERADWKACAQSEEEEKKEAQDFKAAFAEFDFTL
ncbi:hypothetical protein NQZ79_g2046 [Umbelopsis isabellina]|nr:hypothetical protein NQZ79_g2046 [Umbelopsis isabellina]